MPSNEDVHAALVKILARGGATWISSDPNYGVAARVGQEFPAKDRPEYAQSAEVMWHLVSRGLAYIDTSSQSTHHWELKLTSVGRESARNADFNPESPAAYVTDVRRELPETSDLVMLYLGESVHAYEQGCYMASAVMLGVAAEASMIELGTALASFLPSGREREQLEGEVQSTKLLYMRKIDGISKRLEVHKPELPDELREDLEEIIGATTAILRKHRNDSGHPTGFTMSRERMRHHLTIFPYFVGRTQACAEFFRTHSSKMKSS